MGYFAQQSLDLLDADLTIIEQLQKDFPREGLGALRSLAGAFQFSGDDIDKKIRALSGGEKSRLAMARMLFDPPNFLVLDEPTNHLDLATKEMLVDSLKDFEGTMIFVSHDRTFLRGLGNRVLELGGESGTDAAAARLSRDVHRVCRSHRPRSAGRSFLTMPVACLFDIHGNLPALEAVLDEVLQSEADHVVVGGDVLPGPFPRECLDLLYSLDHASRVHHRQRRSRNADGHARGRRAAPCPSTFTKPCAGTQRNSPKTTPGRSTSGR